MRTWAAEDPAQHFLVHQGAFCAGQCGADVGGQLGPGAEVAVCGMAVFVRLREDVNVEHVPAFGARA
ncbi:hypothetical protein SAV14893_093060 [Streptomyces avermitilis]|uniref:Uncharacterized protein n=1 Tax=Streptomyces avermitilis TaxID=33903 RepID=A0A4D4MDE2_STRAX|nr:hypothetical protein SAV14893_093060 [Streptomyces avermitilis]